MADLTKEEIRKFWEWCGWKLSYRSDNAMPYCKEIWEYKIPGKYYLEYESLPEVTLDNLFKYTVDLAIGILVKKYGCSVKQAYQLLFNRWLGNIMNETGQERDAVPLFRAIQEVIIDG